MTQPTLPPILVAGPTASGKSALALALAERVGAVIVNADSMQVYDAAPILTARPAAADLARAPHALYGFVPPQERYSAGRWMADAAQCLSESRLADRTAIFAGGTGLYFNALTQGLTQIPDIADAVRARWNDAAATGIDLHAEIAARDPVMAARLRPSDAQRLVRALEVIDATGRSLADWQSDPTAPPIAPEDAIKIVVAPPRDKLYARIDARFDAMLEAGALDEAREIATLDLDPALPFSRLLGLRPLIAHLSGEMPLEDAVTRAKTDTRRYAKRQMTWLRKFMADWTWVETPEEGIAAVARMSGAK